MVSYISQGSAATHLKCGEVLSDTVTNLLQSPNGEKIRRSVGI